MCMLTAVLAGAVASGPALEPKVLVIGMDGVRPDALAAANTPNLDTLIASGAFSDQAQTGDITVSGPGWSSMLTGVWRDKHGVDDNSFAGSNFDQYPHFFTRLKEMHPDALTASLVQWTPINTFIVSDADIVMSGLPDAGVSAQGVTLLASEPELDALFLHFDDVDHAGHACCYHPESQNYLDAIETTDTLIGPVLAAVQARPTYAQESWLIIVSTDHGGSGTGHGQNIPEHRTIFVIVHGPPACNGTIQPAPGVVEVAATALAHFGPLDPAWDLDGVGTGFDNCLSGTCAGDLASRVDHAAGAVELSWTPAQGLAATSYELRRNGIVIATPDLATDAWTDTPVVGAVSRHVPIRYELRALGGDGPQCPAASAEVVLSTGDVRFHDDFEDHADDEQLEASGWRIVDVNQPVEQAAFTVTNPGGQGHPSRFDGKAATGRFLISDSDFGGSSDNENPTGSGMSHDVWSPSFDCTGLASVWLHLDCIAVLNNNGKAVFDIDVTINNGVAWTNLWRRVAPARTEAAPLVSTANADGVYGRIDIDLSAVAAGQPNVRFRLRHFEPSWDWFVAVDNVIVDDVDLVSGGSVTVLPAEAFSGGLPAAWSLQGLNAGNDTWTAADPCTRSIVAAGVGFPYLDGRAVHRLGVDFALLDSDCNPDPAEDERLLTPALDCSGLSEVFLHYRSEIVTASGATETVLLSLDGGATFLADPLFSYAGGGATLSEDPMFAQRVLRVDAAAGEPQVVFAFSYESPGDQWWWAVDNVAVSGTTAGVPGDVTGDGCVDVNDLVAVITAWGPCLACAADLDGNGVVDVNDLVAVITEWGCLP